MPVQSRQTADGFRIWVDCDRRDDMGRILLPADSLDQWQVTATALARWVANALELSFQPEGTRSRAGVRIGTIQGNRYRRCLNLLSTNPPTLRTADAEIAFTDAVVFSQEGSPEIDRSAVIDLIDRPIPTPPKANPTVQRGLRRAATERLYDSWAREFRRLKRAHKDRSDVWYARQIARSPAGANRSPETIRKHMKPKKLVEKISTSRTL